MCCSCVFCCLFYQRPRPWPRVGSATRRGLAAGLLALAALLAGPGAAAQDGGSKGGSSSSGQLGPAVLLPLPRALPLTEPFTLAVRLRGPVPDPAPDFPELDGFRKAGQTRTTTTRLLPGGTRSTELTLTQRYVAYAEGSYQVPPFDLRVGEQVLHSGGGRVRVGPAPAAATLPDNLPPGTAVGSLDQLLGKPKPKNFYEPPDHASLALEADREQVYVGQGVRVRLSLYLLPADQALLNFYDFNDQLTDLLHQLRQPTTWQLSRPDTPTRPDTVRRLGQRYLRFQLAESTYYPLTAQALRFPAVALTLTKFKLLKNPQPGETERLAIYKTLGAAPLTVAVRPLPPASAAGAVGTLALHEALSTSHPATGQAFGYVFEVAGSGNPATVQLPAPTPPPGLELFGPELREQTLPDGRFSKRFSYRLVARQPGLVPLARLFRLPYFDPATGRADTLRATLRAVANGVAQAQPKDDPNLDAFYGPALGQADARLQPLGVYATVQRYAALLVAGLLALAVVGWWRGKR